MEKWIDISAPVFSGMVHWPGEPEVSLSRIKDISKGDPANVTVLSMSAHTGTHMDAAKHFFADGIDISQIPLDKCIGPAKVIRIQDPRSITLKEIRSHEILPSDRILFRTRNSDSDWTREPFKKNEYIFLATDAAEFLAEKKVSLVGIDYISIGGQDNGKEVHKLLLGSDVWIIEGLQLKDIPQGQYELICLPLRLIGSDGAPARAILRKIS